MSYVENESERVISLLKNAIRLSNFTYRDVERQLGWRVGTITRLLRGGQGLKVEHLLAILGVIQLSPGRFFAAAFPASYDGGIVEDRLARMLDQLHGPPESGAGSAIARSAVAGGPAGGEPSGPAGQEQIDEMVRASLRRLLASDGDKPPGSLTR